jgi:hypothetical protein
VQVWMRLSDGEHMTARNMQRKEINVHEKELSVKLVIYKDYIEMHGQQNIKLLKVCVELKNVIFHR